MTTLAATVREEIRMLKLALTAILVAAGVSAKAQYAGPTP